MPGGNSHYLKMNLCRILVAVGNREGFRVLPKTSKLGDENPLKQAEAEVVPNSSLVEIEVEVEMELGVEVEVEVGVEVQLKCS